LHAKAKEVEKNISAKTQFAVRFFSTFSFFCFADFNTFRDTAYYPVGVLVISLAGESRNYFTM